MISGMTVAMSYDVWDYCDAGFRMVCVLIVFKCVILLILLQKILYKPQYAWIKGLLGTLGFLCVGFLSAGMLPYRKDLPEELNRSYWICKVEDFPVARKKTYKLTLLSQGFYCKDSLHQEKQKILAYFEVDSLSGSLIPGDRILIFMQPVRPRQNGNPGEFNYRNYLYRQGIYYQAQVKKDNWMIISRGINEIRYIPKKIRFHFVSRIKSITGTGEEFGIISALAIGSKDFLAEEIKTSYSEAGAMHVLAVSGLHVGLVWYVLSVLLGGLKRLPYTKFVYYVLMIFLLWMYVMITGMSASVTRAGVMLTIVIASNLFGRGSVSYNPVILSAFILLTINPYLLQDVGFQFSYMAVFGILFFQPRLKKLMTSKNRIVNYFAELMSVSIAAQAGTFIISIYYFNKFPVYFLLTNFVVIPLVTIILVLIIISAFFWFFAPAFNLLTHMGFFIAGIMNTCVKGIEHLPCSSLHDLYFDRTDVLILFISLIFLQLFVASKHLINLKLTLISLICFFIYGGIRDFYMREMTYAALYNLPGIFAFDIADRNLHYLISSGLSLENKEQIIRNCNKFWLMRRTAMPVFIDLKDPDLSYEGLTVLSTKDRKCRILIFQEKCYVVINDLTADESYFTSEKISPEMILVNTGGELKMPSYLSLSQTQYIGISSGFSGRLFINDFVPESEDTRYVDVRSGEAMINNYLPIFKKRSKSLCNL